MKTFDEKFPSLINKHKPRIIENAGVRHRIFDDCIIEENCLDKKRVREVLNKVWNYKKDATIMEIEKELDL